MAAAPSTRPRVAFDTNALVSAALLPGSVPKRAFERAVRDCELAMSLALVTELNDVLYRAKFDRYLSRALRAEFLTGFVRDSQWVEIVERIAACRDPDDNALLELAVNGAASWIVTGDDDLQALDPFRGIRIVSPSAFLTISVPTGRG